MLILKLRLIVAKHFFKGNGRIFCLLVWVGQFEHLQKRRKRRKSQIKKYLTKKRYSKREQLNRQWEKEELLFTSDSTGTEGEEYRPKYKLKPSTSISVVRDISSIILMSKRLHNIFNFPVVILALDKVNFPNWRAIVVAGSVTKAFGHNVENITLTQISIRRFRMQGRVAAVKSKEENFSPNGPLLLHWDGKLLPHIYGSKTRTADYVAVLITGNGTEK